MRRSVFAFLVLGLYLLRFLPAQMRLDFEPSEASPDGAHKQGNVNIHSAAQRPAMPLAGRRGKVGLAKTASRLPGHTSARIQSRHAGRGSPMTWVVLAGWALLGRKRASAPAVFRWLFLHCGLGVPCLARPREGATRCILAHVQLGQTFRHVGHSGAWHVHGGRRVQDPLSLGCVVIRPALTPLRHTLAAGARCYDSVCLFSVRRGLQRRGAPKAVQEELASVLFSIYIFLSVYTLRSSRILVFVLLARTGFITVLGCRPATIPFLGRVLSAASDLHHPGAMAGNGGQGQQRKVARRAAGSRGVALHKIARLA